MADVYMAWDNVRSAKMAVKVLHRDLAMSRRFSQVFQKEAKVLSELQHPNIVRLYEFDHDGEILYIVMSWVDGINLKERIANQGRSSSPDDVVKIMRPVCIALNFAHKMEIYHCDVKPANILLDKNGEDVFLSDFGVARFAQERSGGGTPPYMAPEQFMGKAINGKIDIYALGVTIYEMLSGGNLPYRGDSQSPGSTTREKLAWEHLNLPLPPLQQYNPNLPDGIIRVVEKALSKDPAQRYDNTLAFVNAFEQSRGADHPKGPESLVRERSSTPTSFDPEISRSQPVPQDFPVQPSIPVLFPKAGKSYLYGCSGEKEGQIVLIPKRGLIIGRGSTNHLRLQERSVSRIHATIFMTRNNVYIRDENSSLGTYLNGRRISPGVPVKLNPGDIIKVGYYQVFEFRLR